MGFNPRAAQELDLLLQEGRADTPLLVDGLVNLYANELFRFAWAFLAPDTHSPIIQRLLARRIVTQALADALRQLRRFQEQPGTFLWLLALTYQHLPPEPRPALPALARYLHTVLNLPPEDIAYILNISERRAAALTEPTPEPPPAPARESAPVSAGSRAAFTPLTPNEITALIEQVQPRPGAESRGGNFTLALPRFFREGALMGLALLIFITLVRAVPNTVFQLPTPIPSPTPNRTSTPDWESTPLPIPTAATPFPSDVLYEPENPYLIWHQTQILQDEGALILSMAFSPTDPLLALGTNQSTVNLWDTTTFEARQTLEGHTGGLQSLAFSRDGTLLATGGGDGTVRLWEMPSGVLLQVLEGHPRVITGLNFSPDGGTLAVTAGKELWAWRVEDGEDGVNLATYTPFDGVLYGVRYSPDGKILAVSESDGTGWLLRASDAFPLFSFRMNSYALTDNPILFSPDGNYFLFISRENQIMVVRLKGDGVQADTPFASPFEGEIVKILFKTAENSTGPSLRNLAYSPDGKFLVATTEYDAIYFWDTATWMPSQAPLRQNMYGTQGRLLALASDSQMMAVSRQNNTAVEIWQLEDISAQVARLPEPRYFQRLTSDLYRWTMTYPDVNDAFFDENTMNLEEASAEAGFTVKIPLLEVLEGDHLFESVLYDPNTQTVYANIWSMNDPGLLAGFSLLQRKVDPADPKTIPSPFYLFYMGADQVGTSAIIEPVEIGDLYGEMSFGNWAFVEEENFGVWNEDFQPGDVLSLVTRWSGELDTLRLRWMEGDILYEINASSDPLYTDPRTVREALLLLAANMIVPERTNAIPFTYTIQPGDTCLALAERFLTTVETLVLLNELNQDCTLIAGQTLEIPFPPDPRTSTDLNCDGQEETVVFLRDEDDPTLIIGAALDVATGENIRYRAWMHTVTDMDVASIREPELFFVDDCQQLIILSGGTATASRTRVFQWDGSSMWPILDVPGIPASPDGTLASLEQAADGLFVLPIIEYVPNLYPAAGPCPNEVTDYTWNGTRFEAGETRTVLGVCVEAAP